MRAIAASLPAILAAMALAAPMLWRDHALAAWAITQFFAFTCHQDPARSFWLAGAPVAVCARCLGIYLGAAAGAWFTMSRRSALFILMTAAAVNALDLVAEAAQLHGNWPGLRFTLGLALGVAISALVISAIPRKLISDF